MKLTMNAAHNSADTGIPEAQNYASFAPRHNGTRYRLVFGIPCRKCGGTPLQLEFRDRRLFVTSCPTCGDNIYPNRSRIRATQPATGPPVVAR